MAVNKNHICAAKRLIHKYLKALEYVDKVYCPHIQTIDPTLIPFATPVRLIEVAVNVYHGEML